MHSNSIRSSVLIFLTLNSIYILSFYISIYSLASYFIYYIHINITSISILTLYVIVNYSLNSILIRINNIVLY